VPVKGLLKLQHERRDIGFLSARLTREENVREPSWTLRVESPSDLEEFRVHLSDGSSMALTMVSRDGERFQGEAYVASVSDGREVATMVVLSGAGPLRRA
jgi:hypothetical protein